MAEDMSQPRFPRTVDDVTVRVIAGEVLVLAVLAVVLQQPWLYGVLAVDFTLRTALGPKASPLARIASSLIRPRIAAAPRPTPGQPKRFAAAIGAVFTIAATLAYYGPGWSTVTWVIGAIMILFPALESILGICVGCIAFSLLMRIGVIPRSICEECADIRLRLTASQRAKLADVQPVAVADGVLAAQPTQGPSAQPEKTRSR
ncbi:hypothetical protein GCM10023145_31840 [Angustibacter luteus]